MPPSAFYAVVLAVAGTAATATVTYDAPQLKTFVWVGRGSIGVVLLWAPPDALLFLYRDILDVDVEWLDGIVRAKRPVRLPVVLTREEVLAVLRVLECCRLRVQDLDFGANHIVVRGAKGDKDRVTVLPGVIKTDMVRHLARMHEQRQRDLEIGAGWVELPGALDRKSRTPDVSGSGNGSFPRRGSTGTVTLRAPQEGCCACKEDRVTPKEEIAQFMRGEFQKGGLAKTFGWYGVEWRPGAFEIHWRATDAFTTGQMSVLHGGAVTTLLDTAMGWAAYTVLEDDENFATADLQVQFLRGAKIGLLKARGVVLRRTRALAFCDGEVRDEGDQLVARGSATCSIIKRQ